MAQDAIIVEEDCGTKIGIEALPMIEGGDVVVSLGERVLGRTILEDILDPASGDILFKKGHLLDEADVEVIENAQVERIQMRSPLTCEVTLGICAKCYGRDLARGTTVNIGEAVGVIAAQSIGEPGTQLTMRTFHIGGAAQRGAQQSNVEAAFDSKVKIVNKNVVKNVNKINIVMSRNCEVVLIDANKPGTGPSPRTIRCEAVRQRKGHGQERPNTG